MSAIRTKSLHRQAFKIWLERLFTHLIEFDSPREMRNFRRKLVTTPLIGPIVLFFHRARTAFSYIGGTLRQMFIWLFRSKETSNFTYDLTPENKLYLSAMIADIVGEDINVIKGYLEEVHHDQKLRSHVLEGMKRTKLAHVSDPIFGVGRRLGWYAIARAIKPRVIIETGIHNGLGSCVLTSALIRNTAEGFPGRYFGTDIDPRAGGLLSGEYAKMGEILYGDSIESLKTIQGPVDLFINDSDHSADYEAEEYQTIAPRLSEHAIVLGDNAHVTDRLCRFAVKTGRSFSFFKEQPSQHWYPGAGIGIAFYRSEAKSSMKTKVSNA